MNAHILFSGLDADDTYRRAKSLADDLARMVAGDMPSAADLADAPIIDQWTIVPRLQPALAGVISGHPTIGLLRPGITSGIVALDDDRSFARTWSRFYRLGRRAGDDGRRQ